jgi:hypothetical protein
MNQDQRKFLIEQVQKTCRIQADVLRSKMPKRPSLNNYLVAAFLDNTIKFNDIERLKVNMRENVIRFGTSQRLINESDDDDYYSRSRRSEKTNLVTVRAEDLFIVPENYKTALAEYEKIKKEIEDEIEKLEATTNTIVMKVQLGSSATMDKLIMQIDSMGDLKLMNTQLMLGDGEVNK